MKIRLPILTLLAVIVLTVSSAGAHCEIPCGIYDDRLRTQLIAEHTGTIEKSMRQITELQKADPVNYNQLVRWISNKEHHADEIREIVTQYFMTQRIKPDSDQYAAKIAMLHKMLIAAMKCKQTTDLKHIDTLKELRQTFEKLYFK